MKMFSRFNPFKKAAPEAETGENSNPEEENKKAGNGKLELCPPVLAKDLVPFSPSLRQDDFRLPDAHKKGGFVLDDAEITSKLRSAGKQVILNVGKQVLQVKLNLTNISFPIQCMQARSILQAVASIAALNPSYMTTAAAHPEPLERMKLVMAWSIAHLNVVHSFEKPLNPILGETFVARLDDGTMVYVEQTSHHPPISHAQIVGPDECYTMNLHTGFSAKAGMNSVQLVVVGWK